MYLLKWRARSAADGDVTDHAVRLSGQARVRVVTRCVEHVGERLAAVEYAGIPWLGARRQRRVVGVADQCRIVGDGLRRSTGVDPLDRLPPAQADEWWIERRSRSDRDTSGRW